MESDADEVGKAELGFTVGAAKKVCEKLGTGDDDLFEIATKGLTDGLDVVFSAGISSEVVGCVEMDSTLELLLAEVCEEEGVAARLLLVDDGDGPTR